MRPGCGFYRAGWTRAICLLSSVGVGRDEENDFALDFSFGKVGVEFGRGAVVERFESLG